MAFFAAVIVVITTCAVYFNSPRIYEAKSEFTVDLRCRQGGNGTGAASSDRDSYGSAYEEIFNTRQSDWRSEGIFTKVIQQYRANYPNSQVPDKDLVEMLASSELELVRHSRLITIAVRSKSPEHAAALANAYAEAIESFTDEENKKRQRLETLRCDKVDNLQAELAILNQSLQTATADVKEYEKRVAAGSEWVKVLQTVQKNPETFGKLLDAVAAAKPDLVVLAESAMAEFGPVRSFRAQDVARGFLERSGATALIAGGDDVAEGRTYNAVALYEADGKGGVGPLSVYHKQHLVPFGEYIPFDKWITPLQKLSPVGVSLHPGEPRLIEISVGGRSVKVAPLICYEDTDPRLAAQAKRMGADMIVLVTNDSWFSESAEAEAHAAQAVLRAIETGLPIVRVGNSGVTGVIRPDGSATWLSDGLGRPLVDAPGVMVETIVVK